MTFLLDDDRYRTIAKKLEPWFDKEMGELYSRAAAVRPGAVLMGAPIWGREYIERFVLYCLPTFGTPQNIRALVENGCRIVIYSPPQARPILFKLTKWLRRAGIELQFREIPNDLLSEMVHDYDMRFCFVGCVQNILAHMAGRDCMAYHMMMVDHCYSQGYWENAFRLGRKHEAVVQTGLSVNIDTAADMINEYRAENGALALPDLVMGDIAASNLHPEALSLYQNNGSIPDRIARGPRLIWQSKNALHVYSCFHNAVMLAPHLMSDAPVAFTSTMDCLMPEFIPGDFYVPKPDDGCAFFELSTEGKRVPGKFMPSEEYCEWVWNRVSFGRDYWPYFERPSIMETSRNEDMLEAAEVKRQFAQIMDLLEESRARLLEEFTVRKFGSRFAREAQQKQKTPMVAQDD